MSQILLFAVGVAVFLVSGLGTVVALFADRNQTSDEIRRLARDYDESDVVRMPDLRVAEEEVS